MLDFEVEHAQSVDKRLLPHEERRALQVPDMFLPPGWLLVMGVSDLLVKLRVHGVHGQSMRVKDVIAVLHDTLVKAMFERSQARQDCRACLLAKMSQTHVHNSLACAFLIWCETAVRKLRVRRACHKALARRWRRRLASCFVALVSRGCSQRAVSTRACTLQGKRSVACANMVLGHWSDLVAQGQRQRAETERDIARQARCIRAVLRLQRQRCRRILSDVFGAWGDGMASARATAECCRKVAVHKMKCVLARSVEGWWRHVRREVQCCAGLAAMRLRTWRRLLVCAVGCWCSAAVRVRCLREEGGRGREGGGEGEGGRERVG